MGAVFAGPYVFELHRMAWFGTEAPRGGAQGVGQARGPPARQQAETPRAAAYETRVAA